MVDCYPDADHQPGSAAPAHLPDEIDAENAARRAADQIDSGKIQEIQPARSAQSGNERGNCRTVQERRRQSRRRMSAALNPDALPVRLLQDVVDGARSAAR